MLRLQTRKGRTRTAFGLLELIFHASVRSVRKSHGNAVIGLLLNIFQTVLMIVAFYFIVDLMGGRSSAVRGDFLLYMMSGVFLFMTFNKTMSAVYGSEGPTSAMMQHAPMNTIVAITSAALSALYLQVLSAAVILFVYHAVFTPITIDDPVGMMSMVMLSWVAGLGIGMVFLAAKPWQPDTVGIVHMIFQRVNMFASGKMFLANTLPPHLLVLFSWNPLFHTIDQSRGFMFLNYTPHNSTIMYPVKITIVCLMIGLMGEFYTRKFASASWSAGK